MGFLRMVRFQSLCLALLASLGLPTGASELVTTISTGQGSCTNGERLTVWVNILNPGSAPADHDFSRKLPAVLSSGDQRVPFDLSLTAPAGPGVRPVAPGSFVRVPYEFIVPARAAGTIFVTLTDAQHSTVSLTVTAPQQLPPMFSRVAKAAPAPQSDDPEQPRLAFDPNGYFRRHFFGYDPVYFIAGAEAPTAKFQFSFRYRTIDVGDTGLGWLAERISYATNIYFAYTQVSLWDLAAPSAPFLDTSYKPEIHYWWQNVTRADRDARFHLDLQGGYQHESNGKEPPDSKSINMLYLQPTLFLGDRDRFHLSLGVRAWVYILDLTDNPDIADYRGHFDVRATLGWPDHIQLSALGRVGDGFDHGSAMLDLTYPLFGTSGRGLSLYLHAQYFTGYGESLLEYNRRSDAIRFGFSIYR